MNALLGIDGQVLQKRSTYHKLCEKIQETYERKNADYGDSFTRSLDKRGLVAAIVRMEDKMNRFDTLIDKPRRVGDESIKDTLLDLANYALMTAAYIIDHEKDETAEHDEVDTGHELHHHARTCGSAPDGV